jgi:hypothetical protein
MSANSVVVEKTEHFVELLPSRSSSAEAMTRLQADIRRRRISRSTQILTSVKHQLKWPTTNGFYYPRKTGLIGPITRSTGWLPFSLGFCHRAVRFFCFRVCLENANPHCSPSSRDSDTLRLIGTILGWQECLGYPRSLARTGVGFIGDGVQLKSRFRAYAGAICAPLTEKIYARNF